MSSLRFLRIHRFVTCLAALAAAGAALASPGPDRAGWMREAGWGVMTHYLADWQARANQEQMSVERWNQMIDAFDTEALAEQMKSVGARYFLMTIGQNSGYYLSPNATYDRIAGVSPSKLSRRDLIADLYESLHKRGIKLMVYLPSGAPAGRAAAAERAALEWQNGPELHRNREFQLKWESIIREWSERWGDKVVGWWFDGVYWPNAMYRHSDTPNFASFAAAARAGNPNSAVAFCPGVVYRSLSLTPEEDYIAGEINYPDRQSIRRNTREGKVDGAQLHMLSFLGGTWGMGAPRFTDEQVVGWSKANWEFGGAVTWDVPIQTDGTIAPPFIEQLRAIGEARAATEKR